MTKLSRALRFGLSLVLTLALAGTATADKGYREIDAAGVRALMEQGGVEVIFPLSPIEFDNLHIEGSINIPLEKLASRLPEDKSQPLVFYCLGVQCVASWRAAEKAVDLGYQSVYAFREGLPGWVEAGYPTVSTHPLPKIDIDQISTRELAFLLERHDVVVLDINMDEDAHKFHVDTDLRVHIPLNELKQRLDSLPRDKQIVVMCLKGKRAPTACRYLKSKGFDNVVMLDGGIQKWILEGRPVRRAG